MQDKYEDANIIIFGDMNLKFIDWTTETLRRPANITQTISIEEKTSSHILLDFVNENLLFQMVTENTRKGKTLLDIILTNDEDQIFDVTVEPTNLDTDHDIVNCRVIHETLHSTKNDSGYPAERKLIDNLNYEKAEWSKIKDELSEIK